MKKSIIACVVCIALCTSITKPSMAEPITLTVMAISGIAAIASLVTADMAIRQQDRDHVSVKRYDRAKSQKQISDVTSFAKMAESKRTQEETSSLSHSYQNEPDSFKGIKWETSIKQIGGMIEIHDAGELRTYQRKNDEMKMGDAALKYVDYFFFHDRFCGSMAVYEQYKNFAAIRDSFLNQYGSGQFIRIERYGEEYFWLGKDVNIILRYDERGDKGTVTYIYTPLANGQKQNETPCAKREAQAI